MAEGPTDKTIKGRLKRQSSTVGLTGANGDGAACYTCDVFGAIRSQAVA